jgi:hypothetical protein
MNILGKSGKLQLMHMQLTGFPQQLFYSPSFRGLGSWLSVLRDLVSLVLSNLSCTNMVIYTSGSRRPRLYVFAAGFFLAVLGLSLVGFHDVSSMILLFGGHSCSQHLEHEERRRVQIG